MLRDSAIPLYTQYVPIHTSNPTNDYIYNPHVYCRSINTELKSYSEHFKKIDKKYNDFYKSIKNEYGIIINSVNDVYMLYDDIVSTIDNDIQLTIKYENLKNELDKFREIINKDGLDTAVHTTLKAQLLTYGILSYIRTYFEKAHREENNNLELALFQLSDINILALAKLFSFDIDVNIPFASSMLFELHKSKDKGYYVTVVYNNTRSKSRKTLSYSKEYDSFMDFLKDHTYKNDDEFYKNCHKAPFVDFNKQTYLIISLIIFGVFFIIWGVSWFLVLYKRKGKEEDDVENTSMDNDYDSVLVESKNINATRNMHE